MVKIERALLSVYDKTGIVPFARDLADMGVEIVSTGGTSEILTKNCIKVTPVEEVTGFPEILDGRVKTMHPAILAGILGRPDVDKDTAELIAHNIKLFQIVAVNLYPFAETLRKAQSMNLNLEEEENTVIEKIDVGGPTMLRSAGKNYRHVLPICNPVNYSAIVEKMRSGAEFSLRDRRVLAHVVFETTAMYDRQIETWFRDRLLSL